MIAPLDPPDDLGNLLVGVAVGLGDLVRVREIEGGRPVVRHPHAEERVQGEAPLVQQPPRLLAREAGGGTVGGDEEGIRGLHRHKRREEPLHYLGKAPGVGRRDKADNVRPRKAPVTPLDAPCLVIQGPGDPLGHVLAVSRRGEVMDHLPAPRFLEFACRRILRRRGVAAERMLLPPHSMRGLALSCSVK